MVTLVILVFTSIGGTLEQCALDQFSECWGKKKAREKIRHPSTNFQSEISSWMCQGKSLFHSWSSRMLKGNIWGKTESFWKLAQGFRNPIRFNTRNLFEGHVYRIVEFRKFRSQGGAHSSYGSCFNRELHHCRPGATMKRFRCRKALEERNRSHTARPVLS